MDNGVQDRLILFIGESDLRQLLGVDSIVRIDHIRAELAPEVLLNLFALAQDLFRFFVRVKNVGAQFAHSIAGGTLS